MLYADLSVCLLFLIGCCWFFFPSRHLIVQIPLCRVCSNKVYMHEKKILLNRGTVAIPFLTEYSFTPFVCLSHEKVTTHCTPFFCQLSGGLFFCICLMRKRISSYYYTLFPLLSCGLSASAHAKHMQTLTRTRTHAHTHIFKCM